MHDCLVVRTCGRCGIEVRTMVEGPAYVAYQQGATPAEAFPAMPEGDRAILEVGLCAACLDAVTD